VLGPRTEAWEHIRARIASGRGVRDQDDAITQGMIYVAEDLDEIWIPTSMVADAVESVETSRRALQSELAERGIDSNELSGSGISEAMTSNGTTARFWRLDATHDEVPEPEIVLDEADDPTERSADVERTTTRKTTKTTAGQRTGRKRSVEIQKPGMTVTRTPPTEVTLSERPH